MAGSRTVLLVEDEPGLREAVVVTLCRKGYEVVATGDGGEAEALLAGNLPDLLVVDMLLPGRSGFQVTRLAKERSDGRLPVLMMSGHDSTAHRDYAAAAGVDTFLGKPFSLPELVTAAAALCPQPRPAAPRPVAAAQP